nr:transcription termination factor Rho [Propionibacterium sp.]
MLLPELKKLASSLGIKGATRKADLIAAIRTAQSGAAPARTEDAPDRPPRRDRRAERPADAPQGGEPAEAGSDTPP